MRGHSGEKSISRSIGRRGEPPIAMERSPIHQRSWGQIDSHEGTQWRKVSPISQSGEVDVEPAVPMERSLTHLFKGGRRHSPWSKIAEHVFSLLEPGNLGEKYEDMHYTVDPASVNIFSFP